MNILFAVEQRVDAGSIYALAKYVLAGKKFGHRCAIYGNPDSRFPDFIFSTELRAFDFVVFIFESKLKWISGLQLAYLLTKVWRARAMVGVLSGARGSHFSAELSDAGRRGAAAAFLWI